MMITWGDGQSLAICRSCRDRLDPPGPADPICGFNEVSPRALRPALGLGAIPEGIDEPDGEKGGEGIFGKIWAWLIER